MLPPLTPRERRMTMLGLSLFSLNIVLAWVLLYLLAHHW